MLGKVARTTSRGLAGDSKEKKEILAVAALKISRDSFDLLSLASSDS